MHPGTVEHGTYTIDTRPTAGTTTRLSHPGEPHMRTITLLSLAAALTACGADPRLVTGDDPEVARVVDGTNAFTLDAYRASVAATDDANVFVSPFSMAAALSMTYAGAEGETATEMETVLHIADEDAHHDAFGALIRDLGGEHRRDYTLHVANRIWGQETLTWEQPFLDTNAEDYGAEVELLDIESDPDGTRVAVNDWVEDQTSKRIKDLFKPGTIDRDTRMVLANAIYFKADWADGFDKGDTRPETWTHLDGSTTTVDRMHRTEEGRVGSGEGFRVASLPYESEELAMWVVLPDDHDGLPAVEAALTAESLDAAMDEASGALINLGLPKLETETDLDLKPLLSELGMPLAFTEGAADFSGMTLDERLYIGAAVHKAFVLVDEEGTEAAAATGIAMIRETSITTPNIEDFIVDHPYLFLIRDELTGAVLFIGRVTHPSTGSPE